VKPLNTIEIDALIADCSSVIGAEAQDFVGSLDSMALKLWSSGLGYIVFQTKGAFPFFCFVNDKAKLSSEYLKRSDKKPFFLFYKTHFKGAVLTKVRRVQKYGRLVEFVFTKADTGGGAELILEFRLFPGGVNLGLIVGSKSVYLNKPLKLAEVTDDYQPTSVRSPEVLKDEWFANTAGETSGDKGSELDGAALELKKINKAKEKIVSALEFLKTSPHKRFAEALSDEKGLSAELKSLYRDKLSVRENIEWGFAKQKENELKIERLEERLKQLAENTRKTHAARQKNDNKKNDLKATRHLTLSKDVRAFCGKTAGENLDLLRKSKSWHLWMHLKDYPSGHLILATPKNHSVTEAELKKSALFLFKVAAPKKLHASEQVKFEVIFTETKFVKPIKGAKKGLVQPSRTQSRVFMWNKSENLSF